MSLLMQKNFRSKTERNVSYILVFGVLFAFAIMGIGIAGYTIEDFGFGPIESVLLVLTGSVILLFTLNNILYKVTTGKLRAFSMVLSFLFVILVLVLALIGSGIIEVV